MILFSRFLSFIKGLLVLKKQTTLQPWKKHDENSMSTAQLNRTGSAQRNLRADV
jgi:hypothetical protein